MIKCVIVDDEPRALEIVKDFAGRIPFLQVEAACTDPVEAASIIKSKQPQLLFLDIEMPDISGIQLARTVGKPPYIIFITAYGQYAVEGFNLDAIDYLLKPYSFDRFLKAVNKAREIIERVWQTPPAPIQNDFIIVKSEYQNILVNINDILFIEAMDNYIKIHTPKKTITTLMSLKNIQEALPENIFIRIHKSFVVATSQITAFTKNQVTINSKTLPVGRAYAECFLKYMQNKKS
ncbi:LytR/AlgR family response regulator transcription factor [Geofilum sp. OHC36d9]|uniref:LytR/AlgR family response regulator transcription factor n=1 Tax=Geofilum sp. OHC36d9 TaxID=3458413 RepID=UPI004033A91F